jgi:nucleoside-diphosphate-sugar epimerase
MVRDHLHGKMPGIIGPGDRLWSYSFVDDVARAHVSALEKGQKGERYFLGGDNVTMNDLFAIVARLTGRPAPRLHIPYAVASALGRALDTWAELTGAPPELTHREVGVFREHWAYACDKARNALGYQPTSLQDGLQKTVAWLVAESLVPGPAAARA